MWHLIPQSTTNYGLAKADGSVPEGIPSMRQLLGMYCSLTGIAPPPDNHLRFYISTSLFKMASILHGVLCRCVIRASQFLHTNSPFNLTRHPRSKMGNASASNAAAIGANAYVLADTALHVMRMSPNEWSTTLSGQNALRQLYAPAFASSLSAQSFSHAYMTPSLHETVMKLQSFISSHILPVERVLSQPLPVSLPVFDSLREKARQQGLWNLFLRFTNTEYAPLCEVMGQSPFAPEVFNCHAPDTGNMEVLHHFGSKEQKAEWLQPLMDVCSMSYL